MNYSPTYWNNTATDMDTYNRLFKELVPDRGDASTNEGELLSSISAFTYDQYNNGHCNFEVKLNRYKDMISLLKTLNVSLDSQASMAADYIKTLISEYENMSSMYDYIDRNTTCDYCDGEGEVIADWPTEEEAEEMDTCPECDGHGEIYDEDILSEKEEEELIVMKLINEFSDTEKYQRSLDALTHCIIVHIDDKTNKSLNEILLEKEIDASIEEDFKVTEVVENEVSIATPSQAFYDYIATLRISEDEFKKAASLFAV